ncbi:MAG: SAV_6107 family HEPN domain-containing protein [Kibdelosporangium sp.]
MSTNVDFPSSPLRRGGRSWPAGSPAALLRQAECGLLAAQEETDPAERFAQAYLSALRAAAAMLAHRGRPHRGRSRPASAWTLLSSVAPELREWAACFAACSSTRAAVQAGRTRLVSARSADDLVRRAGQFIGLVARVVPG